MTVDVKSGTHNACVPPVSSGHQRPLRAWTGPTPTTSRGPKTLLRRSTAAARKARTEAKMIRLWPQPFRSYRTRRPSETRRPPAGPSPEEKPPLPAKCQDHRNLPRLLARWL